jgi:hypothetical protein
MNQTFSLKKTQLLLLVTVLASTIQCFGQEAIIQKGNQENFSSIFPVNLNYHYSRTEFIIQQDELDTNGLITSLSLYNEYESTEVPLAFIKIWIKESPLDELEEGDWESDGYTLVFEGNMDSLNCGNWKEFKFDVPFRYMNSQNLIITIEHGYQGYLYEWGDWAYHLTDDYLTRWTASDEGMPDFFASSIQGRPDVRLKLSCLYINTGPNKGICMGDASQLGTNTIAWGADTIIYSWSPAGTLNMTTIEHPLASPAATTTYTLAISDNKCLSSVADSIVVIVGDSDLVVLPERQITYNTCYATNYDDGGISGSYQRNKHEIITFYPCNPYQKIQIFFHWIDISGDGADYLKVYNGDTITYNKLLGIHTSYNGEISYLSSDTTGAITLEFYSNDAIDGEGWEAVITCEDRSCEQISGSVSLIHPDTLAENDTLTLSITGYYGDFLYWERSIFSNTQFNPVALSIPSFSFLANTTQYYRAKFSAGSNNFCYSDVIQVNAFNNFYVNDQSVLGDVFCSSQGFQDGGLTPEEPALDINTILSNFSLKPGDTIFVDAGEYSISNLTFTYDHLGDTLLPIVIWGAGESHTTLIFDENLQFDYCQFVEFSGFTIIVESSNLSAVSIRNTPGISFHHNRIVYSGSESCIETVCDNSDLSDDYRIQYNHIASGATVLNGVKICGRVNGFYFANNSVFPLDTQYRQANGILLCAGEEKDAPVSVMIESNYIEANAYGILSTIDPENEWIQDLRISKNWFRYIDTCLLINRIVHPIVDNNFFSLSNTGISVGDIANEESLLKVYNNAFQNESFCIYFQNENSTSYSDIQNNILSISSDLDTHFCLYSPGNSYNYYEIDANCYYTPNGAGLGYLNGNGHFTLSNWQKSAPGGADEAAGVTGDPQFLFASGGNLNTLANLQLLATGNQLPAAFEMDINSETRSAFNIGASAGISMKSAFAPLQTESDNSCYLIRKGILRFIYNEEYEPISSDLHYRILNSQRSEIPNLPALTRSKGMNAYEISIAGCDLNLPNGIYYLEVENDKKETFYLRFEQKTLFHMNCNPSVSTY